MYKRIVVFLVLLVASLYLLPSSSYAGFGFGRINAIKSKAEELKEKVVEKRKEERLKENKPPNTPSNPSPVNGTTNQPINVTLSWTGGDPDPGDTVTYDAYFGTTTPPTKLVSSNQAGTTYNPGTLNHNTTYYWKIVAKDNHGASTSGPVWSFTTEAQSSGRWHQANGPYGGVISSLAIDPTHARTIYAGTWGGVFKWR
ncbi:TPA: hypothetical protein DCX15_00060 [bacterium]|nr:hypothetical protein [bacterium]